MTEDKRPTCPKCGTRSCKRLISANIAGHRAGKEIWDYSDIRKKNPKWLKSRDGKTRVRYDSSKHGHGKGTG